MTASLASSVPNAARDTQPVTARADSSPDVLATERALAFAQRYSPSDLLINSPAVPASGSLSQRGIIAKRQSTSADAIAIDRARVFAEKYSPNDVRASSTTSEAVRKREEVQGRSAEVSTDALVIERARAFAERYSSSDVAA